MPRKAPKFTPPDGPAIVRPDHSKDRIISPVAGAPRAWRKLSMIEQVYAKRQLRGGNARYTENQRLEAGRNYHTVFMVANGAGTTDSTQKLNVSHSANGFEPPQSQQSAIFMLARIEAGMGARDCRIIRRVCGEGHKPVDAIKDISPDYRHTVSARFRESMDALIEALDRLRADRKKVA